MSKIVGIGANVCDTLYVVPEYPKEDSKLRAESITLSGGGPCATGLVAASKLGADCAYIGMTTDDDAGRFLKADFEKYNVSTEFLTQIDGYTSFCSSIWLSKNTASRTCVFHKGNIPPTVLTDEQRSAICNAELLMVDGNDIDAAVEGAVVARMNGTTVLYDAGGLYDGIDKLLPYCDIIIPSEEFALGYTKAEDVTTAAKILFNKFSPDIVVITQGKIGGIIYDGEVAKRYPAFIVDAVDSNGAGDVFHGAFAFAIVNKMSYYDACVFSSAVSALKCTGFGAREGTPTYQDTVKFLKERGINV